MHVHVLFFGMLKEMTGRTSEWLELPADARISDVLARYTDVPRMSDFLPSLAISLNQEYARRDTLLHDQDEVAFLPPVSGGLAEAQTGSGPHLARARLVREVIDPQLLLAAIRQPSDGAVVTFDGVVRDNSRGRATLFLDYEAYDTMAVREMEKLAEGALAQFSVRQVAIVHRIGRLMIGESSVFIAVAAAHRGPAFEACRWIIDNLKRTVPIWKKEHFADGAVWADGEPFPEAVQPAE